jgi:hypothetical protein
MKFLLVSVTGGPLAEPIEIATLDELLAYLDYDGEQNDLIISKMSLVSKTHDRKQRKAGCEYVLCLYDDFIEEGSVVVKKERGNE